MEEVITEITANPAPEVPHLEVLLDDNTPTFLAFPVVATKKAGALSSKDKTLLQKCEERIETGLMTAIEVAQALFAIKQNRLYRGEYDSFEHYCQVRWEFGRHYAYRLIKAAKTREELVPIGNIPLPENESQARPLTQLPTPEKKAEAMKLAARKAKGTPKTKHIIEAVEELKSAGDQNKDEQETASIKSGLLVINDADDKGGAKVSRSLKSNTSISLQCALELVEEAMTMIEEEKMDAEKLLALLGDIETAIMQFDRARGQE